MYKRAVILMGWLVLSLLIASLAWGAATKDGKPVAKDIQPQASSISPYGIGPQDIVKFRQTRWITIEEMQRTMERMKRQEKIGSVYEAAASLINESPFFSPGVLGETATANFDTAGNSYYDYNANHRNPRMIAITSTNNNVGIAWADIASPPISSPRNVYASLWKNKSKAPGQFLLQIPFNGDLSGRTGFCGVTYVPKTGRLVIYAHHAEDATDGTYFGAENTAGLFDWGTDTNVPDSVAGDADDGIWPTAAGGIHIENGTDLDGDGDNTDDTIEVIHFFSNEGLDANGVNRYIYARALDSAGIWVFKGFNTAAMLGLSVDSGNYISPTVVASKKSAKVALVYVTERDGCNYSLLNCSDVYYIESTNGGQNWINSGFPAGTNVTNFDSAATVRASGDLMGVYDNNDTLVISFMQWIDYDPASGGREVQGDIYVWRQPFGLKKAVDGNWELTGDLPDDGRRGTVNWPHIAVHDGTADAGRTNYLYLVWTQYGGETAGAQGDTNVEGVYNGDVYISCSTNKGKTWSAPLSATNTLTPDCPVPTSGTGTCSGVAFSSCAERADDTIHIAYMTDEYGGSWVSSDNSDATATENEVIYMKYPAFTPPATIRMSVTPATIIANPSSIDTVTFAVQNIGNADMTVDSIVNDSSWLTVLNGNAGFTIIEGDPDVTISLAVDDAGHPDGVYFDTVTVFNNSVNRPEAKVLVIMVVDNINPAFSPQFADIQNTGSVKVKVSNVSNLANQSSSAGFYRIAGGDTTNNLFDASSFLAAKLSGGDTAAGRYLFGQIFMQPLSALTVDTQVISATPITGTGVTIPADTYVIASYKYTAFVPGANGVPYPGPWFGFEITENNYLNTTGTDYLLRVSNVKRAAPPNWWANNPAYDSTSTDVYFGIAADWDVFFTPPNPSLATSIDNYGLPAAGTGVAWQQGAKESASFPTDSTLERNGHFGYTAFMAPSSSPDPFAMHVVSNPYAIYPNSGYDDAQLYEMAADAAVDTADADTLTDGIQFRYFLSDTAAHDSIPTDMNVVMTLGKLSPPHAEKNFVTALGVVAPLDTVALAAGPLAQTGCDALAKEIGDLRAALGLDAIPDLKTKLNCTGTSCEAKPGDANASGNYTLGDVISIVNYVFNKDGCTPKPLCWLSNLLCRGDWNASGNVTLSDVIQAVNFVFNKPGGPWNALPIGVCCLP